MKVIHIATGARPIQPSGAGGTEKDLYFLARHLCRLGCEVMVIDVKTSHVQRKGLNITLEEVWNPPLADADFFNHLVRIVAFALLSTLRLYFVIKRSRIDLIHTHSQFPGIAVLIARSLLRWKIPVVHTIHNSYLLMRPSKANKLKHALEVFVLKMADHIIVETETGYKNLIREFGISQQRITVIPQGLDLESLDINKNTRSQSKQKSKVMLYVGRICPRKNQMVILKAAPQVLERHPEAKFKFVGPTEDKAYFKSLCDIVKQKLSPHVGFAGELSGESLLEVYRSAFVFIFPSLYETQGVVLLEAMAFGMPVIASKIGPIEDIVKLEPGSAILIDPHSPDEIAEAIIRVLENEELRKELSRKGRKLVLEHFRWEQIANEILKVYNQVASSKD
ncbi:glycosyltransferase family 4 protein [Dehalococcoidia bacterium]|nr:glycosyltransferase family 4 protein [Dehalococcoidia bacterium]